jgi:hypothetical protein
VDRRGGNGSPGDERKLFTGTEAGASVKGNQTMLSMEEQMKNEGPKSLDFSHLEPKLLVPPTGKSY